MVRCSGLAIFTESFISVARRIAAWGDPLGIAVDSEREARMPRHKGIGWIITEKYLIRRSFFNIDILRISDIIWIYKRVTKQTVLFIPYGKSSVAVIKCYDGAAEIANFEKIIDDILAFIIQRAPWVIAGYSDELDKLMNNPAASSGVSSAL